MEKLVQPDHSEPKHWQQLEPNALPGAAGTSALNFAEPVE